MSYSPSFNPSYAAWHDLPTEDTPVTAAVMANYDGAIQNIESFLDGSTAIKPVEKTGLMTKSVGVDANGNLWTAPLDGTETFDASSIEYSNTSSGMTATDVQAAIDELAGSSGGGTAETTTYSNTTSGLTATNVQAAIDEIVSEAGTPVSPTAKTEAMTQAVGVDSNGALWTAPSGESEGGTSYGDYEWTTLLDVREEASQTASSYTLSETALNYDDIEVCSYYLSNAKYIIDSHTVPVSKLIADSTTACYTVGSSADNHIVWSISADGLTITREGGGADCYIFAVYGCKKKEYECVTSGMLRWFDAIDNTGAGHSTSATTWADLSGNQDSGTVDTSIWSDTCVALNGNPVNTQYVYGSSPTVPITIDVYVNSGNLDQYAQAIGNTSGSGIGIQVDSTSTKLEFLVHNGSSYQRISHSVKKFENYHLVVTFDPDSKLFEFYVNGEKIGEDTLSNSYNGNSYSFKIGSNGAGDYKWYGGIYDIKIYNRVLTAAEVEQNYLYDIHRFI